MKTKLHIEIIRILAAFFVIFNHTGDQGFFLFAHRSPDGLAYWVYSFIGIFCKISVPLFFMISGALLLNRDMSNKSIAKKIVRILIVLFVFSWLTVLGVSICTMDLQKIIDFKGFFIGMYCGSINFSYWYLYAYLAMLTTLPILRCLTKQMSRKMYRYLLLLFLIFTGIIPCVQYLFCQDTYRIQDALLPEGLLTYTVFYPLLGYYLEEKVNVKNISAKKLGCGVLISIACILISVYMTYFKQVYTGECKQQVSQDFHSSFIVIPCIIVYLIIKKVIYHKSLPIWFNNLITSMGSCTFGIYLLHMTIKMYLDESNLLFVFLEIWKLNDMIAMLVYCFIIFMIGYGITFILKKIPFLNKVI